MEEDKKIDRYDDEIEIDLVELWHELMGNVALIGGVTAAFVAAAAAYSFMVLKPVYGYSALLRMPNYNPNTQATCVEMLKGDLGQGGLSGVSLLRGSAVISLSFSGSNPDKLAADAKAYLPKAVEKVQKITNEFDATVVGLEKLKLIEKDIAELQAVAVKNGSSDAAKLEALVKDMDSLKPKVELSAPEKASNVPIAPNKKKNIGLAFAAGLFLSCGWVVARYIFRKSREGK